MRRYIIAFLLVAILFAMSNVECAKRESNVNKLQIMVIAARKKLTGKRNEEISDAFRIFDKNGDSYIDIEELINVETNIGEKLTTEEAEAMMREVDLDGDNRLDFEEFTKTMTI